MGPAGGRAARAAGHPHLIQGGARARDRDLRALAAAGASPATRAAITAATAGALALTGAVVGIVGGSLAAIGFFRGNQLDGLSALSSIPVANLLIIAVGLPVAAVVIGWPGAGREPAGLGRQPLD